MKEIRKFDQLKNQVLIILFQCQSHESQRLLQKENLNQDNGQLQKENKTNKEKLNLPSRNENLTNTTYSFN